MTDANTFRDLADLLDRDPDEYRRLVERLKRDDPARLEKFLSELRTELESVHQRDDRPLTDPEIEDLIDRTAIDLGWPRARVLSEAVFRLREAMAAPDFAAVTPEREPERRSGKYARRMSSLRALVVGDGAVIRKHGRSRRRDPRAE